MALPITLPTDYTGYYRISSSNVQDEVLELYITQFEELYGRKVLGDKIWDEIATQSPLDTKYDYLINGITYTDTEGDVRINRGLKEMLKGFVYYSYVGDNFINTTTGNVRNHNENSKRLEAGINTQTINTRYNTSVGIYNNDIWLFLDNYKESTGIITSSVDNTGTYTITVPDTLYIENGDIVTIEGVEYTVASVVANISFDITEAAPGLDFAGDQYVWEPFKDVCKANVKRAWL